MQSDNEDIYNHVIDQIKEYIERFDDVSKYSFAHDEIKSNVLLINRNGKKYSKIDITSFSNSQIMSEDSSWVKYLSKHLPFVNTDTESNTSRSSYIIPKRNDRSSSVASSYVSRTRKYDRDSTDSSRHNLRSNSYYHSDSCRSTPMQIPFSDCPQRYCYGGNICSDSSSSGSRIINGSTGATGATGATGSQGIQGIPGLMGDKGDTGAPGCSGSKGDTGRNGRNGDTGVTGATGSKGDTGATGMKGKRGKKGDTGCKGPTGCEGRHGRNGCDGERGERGPKGCTGPRGLCGLGFTGNTGATGSTGLIGNTGPTGIQGVTGDTGPQGIQGIQGLQGLRGIEGPTGPNVPLTITNFNLSANTTNNLRLDRTIGYIQNPNFSDLALQTMGMDSAIVSDVLNSITTPHDKVIIGSSNVSISNINNHNDTIISSNDGTISNNVSYSSIDSSNNFLLSGNTINSSILASKGTTINNSMSSIVAGSNGGLVNISDSNNISNVKGGGIIGSGRNNNISRISQNNSGSGLGTSIISSNDSSLLFGNSDMSSSTLLSCVGNEIANEVIISDSSAFLGAAITNVTGNNINNSSIIGSSNINVNNAGFNNNILSVTNSSSIDYLNSLNQTLMVSSDLNGSGSLNIKPRTSNTMVGANSTGLTWELNSQNGSITSGGPISANSAISGFCKMMENMVPNTIIQPGLLLRIVAKNKVRICLADEEPHLVSREFNSCAFITNNADFRWNKAIVTNEWGTPLMTTVVDTFFQSKKLKFNELATKISNIISTLSGIKTQTISKINIINAITNKTTVELNSLMTLQSDLSLIEGELSVYNRKYTQIVSWLTANSNLTMYIEVPQLSPDYNSSESYLPRNKRLESWTPCEWMGTVPVIVDLSVVEEEYVTSGLGGIGKNSPTKTRIFCTEILEDIANRPNISLTTYTKDLLATNLYKIALCVIGL